MIIAVEMHASAIITLNLISDLENLFSSVRSHGEYLCQLSLDSFTICGYIVSRK